MTVLSRLHNGFIASCQAAEGHPLFTLEFATTLVNLALLGGCDGIRSNGPEGVRRVREVTDRPIIGINKRKLPGYEPYITVTFEAAVEVAEAGADIIAVDATLRPRPVELSELAGRIRDELGVLVMADVSNLEEGENAARVGFDLVATTMAGYTEGSRAAVPGMPDFGLIQDLAARVRVPVVAEGRISSPEDAVRAFKCGAHAVVVGGALLANARVESFVGAIKREVRGEP